jgi:hypothetical protein
MAFGGFLKQSTAVDVLLGPFVDSTDGDTDENALTISQGDVLLSKNGQSLAQKNDATACAFDSTGYYNCELDATDTNTVGQLTVIVHESGALPVRLDFQVVEGTNHDDIFSSNSIVDKIWDELFTAGAHRTRHSAGWLLMRSGGGSEVAIATGTAQGAGSGNNQIQLASGSFSTNDVLNGTVVVITGGTGIGQSRTIFDYDGASVTATVDRNWVTNPDATSTYAVYASSTSNILHDGTAQSGGATTIQLATSASAQDDFYNGCFVNIISGTGSGQTRIITDYAGGTTTATVAAWGTNPDSTSVYVVIPVAGQVSEPSSTAPTVEEIRAEFDDNSTDMNTTVSDLVVIQNTLATITSDLVVIDGEVGDITGEVTVAAERTWAAAVVLGNTAGYSGTDAVVAADGQYDYTSDVDLETAGYNGVHILVEVQRNPASGARNNPGPDTFQVDVFPSQDGTIFDTIASESHTAKPTDVDQFSFVLTNIPHFRLGLKGIGSTDTFDYRITHQRWT